MDNQKFIKIIFNDKPFLKKKLDASLLLSNVREILNITNNTNFIDEDFPISIDDESTTQLKEILRESTLYLHSNSNSSRENTNNVKDSTIVIKSNSILNSNSSIYNNTNIVENKFSSINCKYFEFSNNNKTIKKTFPNTEWTGAMTDTEIVKNKINEFSVMINKTERLFINIGYAYKDIVFKDDYGYCEEKFSWMCNLANGKFKNGGVNDLVFFNPLDVTQELNCVYTICFDLINDLIWVKRNGVDLGEKLKLQIMEENKHQKICPCIDILEQNDIVTIV